jgi:pilus assembly protein CpaF
MADAMMHMTKPGARPLAAEPQRSLKMAPSGARHQLKSAVHHELIKRVDLEKLWGMQGNRDGQGQLTAVIQQLIAEQGTPLSAPERDRLGQEVLDELFGLGPIEPLLQDPSVNDILVNTHETVYVERRGVLEKTQVVFKDNAHLMHIIDKIVSAVGRRVDESSPMVDARLPDGSRVNIIIPPLAIDGPIV